MTLECRLVLDKTNATSSAAGGTGDNLTPLRRHARTPSGTKEGLRRLTDLRKERKQSQTSGCSFNFQAIWNPKQVILTLNLQVEIEAATVAHHYP